MNRVEPNRNIYVGHRYVPLLVGEWDKSVSYEGLSIVTYQGASYTSKKRTPAGIDIENEDFWVLTGNYNAQVEYYRDDVNRYRDEVDGYKDDTDLQIQNLNNDIGNNKSELIQARDGHPLLKDRLDESDVQLEQTASNVKTEGAKADSVTDDKISFDSAFTKNYKTILPKGTYKLSQFYGIDNQHVDGMGSTLSLYKNTASVLAAFGNNSIYENIIFESTETDLEWVRSSLEDTENVIFRNCTFRGFRNPTNMNAWGIYLKRTKNITLDNCKFSNNSQSDIAILEGSENVTIINPQGENGEKVRINFEPNNGTHPIKNVTIIGGDYERIHLLENDPIANSLQNIKIESATIDTLLYDGANVEFVNCNINDVLNKATDWDINLSFAGVANFNDCVLLGKNLIKDPRIVSLSRDNPISNWKVGYSTLPPSQRYRRINDSLVGRAVRLNPDGLTGVGSIKPTDNISVSESKKYLLAFTARALYNTDASYPGRHIVVKFYDVNDTEIKSITVYTCRGVFPSTTSLNTEVCVVIPPSTATSLTVQIGNQSSSHTNKLDIVSVTLHEMEFAEKNKGDTSILSKYHTVEEGPLKTSVSDIPLQTNAYFLNSSVGDKLSVPPVEGGYMEYVCTVAGDGNTNAGTWKGVGLIEE